VKFFRTVLDYLEPGTLLLAEACQPPKDVVAYFGEGDECQGAYHFPVMPRIYRALAEEQGQAIEMVMHPDFTPEIPESAQWFMFLRCHDELSLEMVTPEERSFILNTIRKIHAGIIVRRGNCGPPGQYLSRISAK
jgi:maltose alpha-D-glucosyltransferase/alpha-amylase